MDNKNIIEGCLYIIDKIRPEIERGNFRAIYRYVKYLEQLVRITAIEEEREQFNYPIIIIDRNENK